MNVSSHIDVEMPAMSNGGGFMLRTFHTRRPLAEEGSAPCSFRALAIQRRRGSILSPLPFPFTLCNRSKSTPRSHLRILSPKTRFATECQRRQKSSRLPTKTCWQTRQCWQPRRRHARNVQSTPHPVSTPSSFLPSCSSCRRGEIQSVFRGGHEKQVGPLGPLGASYAPVAADRRFNK